AASVRSEPGSNSQVHLNLRSRRSLNEQTLNPSLSGPIHHPTSRQNNRQTHKRNCNASKRYNSHAPTPSRQANSLSSSHQPPTQETKPRATHVTPRRTPPTYPFLSLFICQRAPRKPGPQSPVRASREAPCSRLPPACQRDYISRAIFSESVVTH